MTEEERYKIVNMSYTEKASVVVRAEDNDEAEAAVFETFPDVQDLRILSIEDASPELVADVKQQAQDNDIEKVLN